MDSRGYTSKSERSFTGMSWPLKMNRNEKLEELTEFERGSTTTVFDVLEFKLLISAKVSIRTPK